MKKKVKNWVMTTIVTMTNNNNNNNNNNNSHLFESYSVAEPHRGKRGQLAPLQCTIVINHDGSARKWEQRFLSG
jgi:hypothetical protein